LDILLSNTSGLPIYEQITIQIKSQIINGDLDEGALLPSIRNLAKDLRISVITTKRAYDELEREGYINTIPGKGTFIAARNIEIIKEEYLRNIEEHLRQVVQLADFCSLGEEDIVMMYRLVREGETY